MEVVHCTPEKGNRKRVLQSCMEEVQFLLYRSTFAFNFHCFKTNKGLKVSNRKDYILY